MTVINHVNILILKYLHFLERLCTLHSSILTLKVQAFLIMLNSEEYYAKYCVSCVQDVSIMKYYYNYYQLLLLIKISLGQTECSFLAVPCLQQYPAEQMAIPVSFRLRSKAVAPNVQQQYPPLQGEQSLSTAISVTVKHCVNVKMSINQRESKYRLPTALQRHWEESCPRLVPTKITHFMGSTTGNNHFIAWAKKYFFRCQTGNNLGQGPSQ